MLLMADTLEAATEAAIRAAVDADRVGEARRLVDSALRVEPHNPKWLGWAAVLAKPTFRRVKA
jgi:hypothetical protein